MMTIKLEKGTDVQVGLVGVIYAPTFTSLVQLGEWMDGVGVMNESGVTPSGGPEISASESASGISAMTSSVTGNGTISQGTEGTTESGWTSAMTTSSASTTSSGSDSHTTSLSPTNSDNTHGIPSSSPFSGGN